MKLFLHDYGRYAFSTELACGLAAAGHHVVYAYSELDTCRSTVEQAFCEQNLTLHPIRGAASLQKASMAARYRAEVGHGVLAGEAIQAFNPDVVISANTPLDAQQQIVKAARNTNAAFVYWLQDVLSLAISRILPKKVPIVGAAVASRYVCLERSLVRQSDHVVAICEDFRDMVRDWGVDGGNVSVVENWAPALSGATRREVDDWRRTHRLQDAKIVMYAGTLGMKHSPDVVSQLAGRLAEIPNARLVVLGEGPGVDWLKENVSGAARENLLLLPFEPLITLPIPLAAADVLLVLLEADAGDYCVPSKILTYMRAGKPILASMPSANPASKRIDRLEHGIRVDPADFEALTNGALRLLQEPQVAAQMGQRAKEYADDRFSPARVIGEFESILAKVHQIANGPEAQSEARLSRGTRDEAFHG